MKNISLPCIDCHGSGKCDCSGCKSETCLLCGGTGYSKMVRAEDLAFEMLRQDEEIKRLKARVKELEETK